MQTFSTSHYARATLSFEPLQPQIFLPFPFPRLSSPPAASFWEEPLWRFSALEFSWYIPRILCLHINRPTLPAYDRPFFFLGERPASGLAVSARPIAWFMTPTGLQVTAPTGVPYSLVFTLVRT